MVIPFSRGWNTRLAETTRARLGLRRHSPKPTAWPKGDGRKLALAARLRQETTISVKEIAERLHLGEPKGARTNLHKIMTSSGTDDSQTPPQM